MRDFSYLLSDPSVDRWLRFKQPLTRSLYCRTLEHFIQDFTGPEMGLKEPSAIVAWTKKTTENIEVQDVIEKYGESQPRTAQLVRMSMIRSFLKKNGVSLPSGSSARQFQKEYHRGYTRQEVQSLLSFLDSDFQKLYVLIGKDSGLRAQDILSLTYGHLRKDLEAGLEYVHIRFPPAFYNRKKASGLTFIGPDSVKLLKTLMAENLVGFTETQVNGRVERKHVGLKDDALIFPFVYVSIAKSLARAKEKARLDRSIQMSHGLRKFYTASLQKLGLDASKMSQLTGHSLGVMVHYTDQNIEELRKLYESGYQYLDLGERAVVPEKLKEILDDNAILREKNQKLEARLVELTQKMDVTAGGLEELLEWKRESERVDKKKPKD